MADKSLMASAQAAQRQIEASDAELARYRARLGVRLRTDAGRARRWSVSPLLAAAAVAAIAVVLSRPLALAPEGETVPAAADLATLDALAVDASPELLAAATRIARQPGSPARWNAHFLLTASRADTDAVVPLAAAGAEGDPRPELRFRYLEYILDRGDEWRYDPEYIERLMERETDPACLRLYRELLHLIG